MDISHWIEYWAAAHPGKIAIHFGSQAITYRDFDARIRQKARMLKNELGIEPGDRLAYLGQNDPRMLILLFACARVGAILLPLNWRLAAAEHLRILQDSGTSVCFVDEPYREQCEEFKEALTHCTFVAIDGECRPEWLLLPELLERATGDDHHAHASLESPLLLIYTSGTTGFPKGALLTQEALQFNAFNSRIMHDMTSHDVILTFLPMFHVGGLNNQTTAGFYAGATVILHRTFDPETILNDIKRLKPTLTIVLPAHMMPLRALPDWENTDFSCLRSVLTGSTFVPDEMTKYWHAKGISLIQTYGASETCPIAIHQTADNAVATQGSIGFPAMHCEVRIVADGGTVCGAGEPGEIQVRGKNVMTCYWNNEQATRENLTDGWFHTGDIGYFDNSGCYHFLARERDVIISGSENIYPAEIENVLMNHPDILEVAVIGRKDPRWGETVVAVIVAEDGRELNEQQVLGWLDGKLGRYKHPRALVFMDALPRNEMRKVQKNVLRDLVN